MLRILILPISIYLVKVKMHSIESRIRKMETRTYLDLSARKELGHMKKILGQLHDQEAALHFSMSL